MKKVLLFFEKDLWTRRSLPPESFSPIMEMLSISTCHFRGTCRKQRMGNQFSIEVILVVTAENQISLLSSSGRPDDGNYVGIQEIIVDHALNGT
jgi:hypothetical protein